MRFKRILGFFRSGWTWLTLVLVATLFAACGSRHTEAEKPATPSVGAPPAEFEMNKIPEASSAAPTAHDAGAPKQSTPPPPKKAKSMQPVFTSEKGVATIVGTPGAVFKVGAATLRIPEDALRDGKDIHFGISKTPLAKGEPVPLGAVFDVGPTLASTAPAFELTLPIPADAGEVVLVILRRSQGKDGKVKLDVTTVAPKSQDAQNHEGFFELPELPEGEVFVAKKPASAAPAATTLAAPPAASGTPPPQH